VVGLVGYFKVGVVGNAVLVFPSGMRGAGEAPLGGT